VEQSAAMEPFKPNPALIVAVYNIVLVEHNRGLVNQIVPGVLGVLAVVALVLMFVDNVDIVLGLLAQIIVPATIYVKDIVNAAVVQVVIGMTAQLAEIGMEIQ
jgi:hypothetical protein